MPSKKSSSNKRRLSLLIPIIASAMLLGGCADYVKRRDTITLSAGEAQDWNKVVHTADPWPPYVMDTNIPGNGQRTAGVIRAYSTGSNGQAGSNGAAAPAGGAGAAPQ